MRRSLKEVVSSACAFAMIVNCFSGIAVYAQDKQKQEERQPRTVERTVIFEPAAEATFDIRVAAPQTQEGRVIELPREGGGGVWVSGAAQGTAQTFEFVSAEMSFDNNLVKGAPFSGEMVFESVQTLSDGNRIVNRSSTMIYRDSQGRTRREQEFTFFGPLGGGSAQRKNISISDPVENVNYVLDPQEKTARKAPTFARFGTPPMAVGMGITVAGAQPRIARAGGGSLQSMAVKRAQPAYPEVAKAAGAEGPVQVQITVNENGEVTSAEAVSGHPLLRDAAVAAAKQWQFNAANVDNKAVKVNGVLTFNFVLDKKEGATAVRTAPRVAFGGTRAKIESKTEPLGKQMIEGIEAEGTRTIDTIPAGAIGNERPIEIVRERWYSPELQMAIMTRSVDPRLGETTQRLINVTRAEPDPSLFQVPPDYTLSENDNFKMLEDKMIRMRKPNEQQ